ncbi:MAG: HD domain-containing protein [Bacteroidetes bacterium]|nr:HD domain-containing protein [Bacteroidota bacterium]
MISSVLNRIGSGETEWFHRVGQVADALGYPCFAVGGIVRNSLLGLPSKDLDFVCEGSGIQLAEAVAAKLGPKVQVNVFKNFGTAQIRYGEWDLEFVGARRESYRQNSRKPIVEDGSIADDQLRRDFTINAMAICVNAKGFGELIDPFDGQADLERKCIRTPLEPDKTFSDDPLRMMRAARFAAQLHFDIHPETLAAISRQKARISIISQERITEELNKIILTTKPSEGFVLLFNTGLLDLVFPEFTALHGVEIREGKAHKDNFYHTLQVLDNLSQTSDDLWLRWSAILHDIAKPPTKRFNREVGWTFHGHEVLGAKMVPKIFRKLKLPLGDPMRLVEKMVLLHLRPISLTRENVTDSAIRRLLFEAGDDIDLLMLLCEADITSKNKRKVIRYLDNFNMVRQKLQEVEAYDRVRNWQPPISGEDIMETFSLQPSKEVGEIKNAIREAILDGVIHNDETEARRFMLEMGARMGLHPSEGKKKGGMSDLKA